MSLNHERVQPILRVDGLNVELKIRNKQKKLVENVSFEVEPGQVMDLLIDLKEKLNLTYVFITHDLTSVTYLCDEVLFLYRGHITECRPVRELGKTTDEYARRLLQAIV